MTDLEIDWETCSENNFNHEMALKAPKSDPPLTSIPFISTSMGATVDSFYRSAMNSLLNQRLTGKSAALFPNMHIQLPIRIIYLNGIKNVRFYMDQNKPFIVNNVASRLDPFIKVDRNTIGMGLAVVPGLVMTPFSSVLEASNAGHMNPESMVTRWTRGLIPRGIREVIFAIGMNQVADSCESLVPSEDKTIRSVGGSIMAGCAAGYLSHVPHNLSTLKLLNPKTSYASHFQTLMNNAINARFPTENTIHQTPLLKRVVGLGLVFLFPRGVQIRTMQIIGSFVIVNGTIAALRNYDLDNRVRGLKSTPISP